MPRFPVGAAVPSTCPLSGWVQPLHAPNGSAATVSAPTRAIPFCQAERFTASLYAAHMHGLRQVKAACH